MSTSAVSIPVPSSGFGSAVDVSSLVGEKTVVLSGRYRGAYVLYGSHQFGVGARFAPLLIFNAGGIESIRQTFKASLAQVKLKSLAIGASGVAANISGLAVPGDNSFASVGIGGMLDLGTNSYQVDLNFMGFGVVNGAVVVEGSLDGMGFNPLGEFAASLAGSSLLGGGSGIEFSPIVCPDRIRYVRLKVQGRADAGFMVTVGGAVNEGGMGGAGTLAVTYDVGSSQPDQTMTISDAKGGMVVFDASEGGFTGSEVLQVLVPEGIGAGFKMDGGMRLGFEYPGSGNILINCSDSSPLVDPVLTGNVVIGDEALQADSTSTGASVVIGAGTVAVGICVAVGSGAVCEQGQNVAVGVWASCFSRHNPLLADTGNVSIGTASQQTGGTSVTIGDFARSFGDSMVCIGDQAKVGTAVADNLNGVSIGSFSQVDGWLAGIAIGNTALAVGNNSISIGSFASCSQPEINDIGQGIAIGFQAQVFMANSIGIGSGVHTGQLSEQNIVIGADSGVGDDSAHSNNILVGISAAACCDSSIVIGGSSTIGDVSIPSTACVSIGPSSSCFGNYDVALGSGAGVGTNFPSVVSFDYGTAVGSGSYVSGNQGVAVGCSASVSGDNGIAIGFNAMAGAGEIVFSSSFAGGANKFEVVGNTPGNPDLFNFDVASLVAGANTTCLSLLIKKHDGTSIALLPVTLSAPIGGISALQVANV